MAITKEYLVNTAKEYRQTAAKNQINIVEDIVLLAAQEGKYEVSLFPEENQDVLFSRELVNLIQSTFIDCKVFFSITTLEYIEHISSIRISWA